MKSQASEASATALCHKVNDKLKKENIMLCFFLICPLAIQHKKRKLQLSIE